MAPTLTHPDQVLAALAPAAGGELTSPVPALPLVISLRATLPGGVAEADACLGEPTLALALTLTLTLTLALTLTLTHEGSHTM